MFGSKKDKEEKKEGGDPIKIEYQDRRSSTRSAGEDGEFEGEEAVDRDTGSGEEGEDRDEHEVRSAELLEQLQRLQAEFDNYRKRIQRERRESWTVAKRDMVLALLPYMDDMFRVLNLDDQELDSATLLEGMKLAANKFLSILREEGLEHIEATGEPFDPNFHEALMTEEIDNPDQDNLVAEVLVEGYLFKGVLLRPARVKVLKYRGVEETGPEETEAQADGAGEEGDPAETGEAAEMGEAGDERTGD